MLITKKLFIVKVFAFSLLITLAACETKTEKKVEITPVIKDTVVKVLDTTAKARPRVPGD